MLSLLIVPVKVSDSCVPVTLTAHAIDRGDSTDNIPSNTDVVLTVVNNIAVIIIAVTTIVNIKTSFDILLS